MSSSRFLPCEGRIVDVRNEDANRALRRSDGERHQWHSETRKWVIVNIVERQSELALLTPNPLPVAFIVPIAAWRTPLDSVSHPTVRLKTGEFGMSKDTCIHAWLMSLVPVSRCSVQWGILKHRNDIWRQLCALVRAHWDRQKTNEIIAQFISAQRALPPQD